MSLATSVTSPKANTAGREHLVDVFHIDEIPGAMDKMGWVVAAKMMRRWFDTKPDYAMTNQVRDGTVPPSALKPSQYDDQIIKMDWALGFSRCVPMFEDLVMHWNSPKGITRLKGCLEDAGWTRGASISLGSTRMCARELEETSQVNFSKFGQAMDTLDDMYGALGNAIFKLAVVGRTKQSAVYGREVFEVDKLGVYIRDTYDFTDDFHGSEPLGIWSRKRILNKLETAAYLGYSPVMIAQTFQGFVPVFNRHFRRWQQVHKEGGDFVVYSDVMWLPSPIREVPIPI